MIERRQNAALGVKALQKKRRRETVADDLDRDQFLELIGVAHAEIDDSHPAAPKLPDDAVRTTSLRNRREESSRLRGVGDSSRGCSAGKNRRAQKIAGAIVA